MAALQQLVSMGVYIFYLSIVWFIYLWMKDKHCQEHFGIPV